MEVLEERNFPASQFFPVASEDLLVKSSFQGKEYDVISAEAAIAARPEISRHFFCRGDPSGILPLSLRKWAARVVDNSSYWRRMDPTKKRVIPEINPDVLSPDDYIIANPNFIYDPVSASGSSAPQVYHQAHIVVSTYQSVTGSGNKAVAQMEAERNGGKWGEYPAFYNYPIDQNVIPHIDVFLEDGYTKEERKMMDETHKILGDDKIGVSATTARVPVRRRSLRVNQPRVQRQFDLAGSRRIWENTPGCCCRQSCQERVSDAALRLGKDDVFVGRVRRDPSVQNGLNFWCVSDNIRKGAATNAIQIAEVLIEKGFLPRY